MISLKLTKKQKDSEAPVAANTPDYPYGMELDFNKELIEKIPILDKMDVGDKVYVQAVGKVVTLNIHANESEKSRSVNVQLTEIEISQDPKKEFKAGFESEGK